MSSGSRSDTGRPGGSRRCSGTGAISPPAPSPAPRPLGRPAAAGQPPLLRGGRERGTGGAPGPAGGWVVVANFGQGSLEGGRVLRSGRVVRSASWGCLGFWGFFGGGGVSSLSFFSWRMGRNGACRLQSAQLSTDAPPPRASPVPGDATGQGSGCALRARLTEPRRPPSSRPVPSRGAAAAPSPPPRHSPAARRRRPRS